MHVFEASEAEVAVARAAAAAMPASGANQPAMLDPLQQRAVDIALSGKNLFLTGGPGTGKSHTLRHIIKQLRDQHAARPGAGGGAEDVARNDETVLVTAPTGVASILVGGQTLFAKPGPGQPNLYTQTLD